MMYAAKFQFTDNLIAVTELLLLPYATQEALQTLQKIAGQGCHEFLPLIVRRHQTIRVNA
jgi:hypothetical protein